MSPNVLVEEISCTQIQVGDFVILREQHPCIITEFRTSKPGKNVMKKYLVGFDIFTGRKYEDLFKLHSNVQVPKLTKHEYLFIGEIGRSSPNNTLNQHPSQQVRESDHSKSEQQLMEISVMNEHTGQEKCLIVENERICQKIKEIISESQSIDQDWKVYTVEAMGKEAILKLEPIIDDLLNTTTL
ncbi:hypothetical protein FDP41_010051 [Naegleria fowleri]|uniref:Translation initiation factor 5A-like N-terminal domain-containing protein n=1 Tax=Naegleria fowleri TaxID=5763 RepID=A0A6A5BCX0_NAEFO|nr:uncharacterized protein FDP41_010051 [Naegleria fowleri]KAF0971828.1 hypothetical protein FDP41_010051 [Naegleria fowleri]